MATESNANSHEYRHGLRDAQKQMRHDLAATLRTYMIEQEDDEVEVISEAMARNIFAGVFGVMQAEREFGSDPLIDRLLGEE